jgi:hypothetical protein
VVGGANDAAAKEDVFLVEMLGRVAEEMANYEPDDPDEWFTPRNDEDFAFDFDANDTSYAVSYLPWRSVILFDRYLIHACRCWLRESSYRRK